MVSYITINHKKRRDPMQLYSVSTRISFRALSISMLILSGCASGLHKEKLETLMSENAFKGELEPETKADYGKIAVWMNIETVNSKGEFEQKWKWDKNDLNIVESYLSSLKKERKISSHYFVKTSELAEKNFDSLVKKTTEGTNSALIIRTFVETDRYFNPAAILDLTIIGAYWFPGSNRDALAKTRVELLDIASKKLIFASEGQGTTRLTKPSFLIDTEEVVSKAKSDSLRDAMRKIFSRLSTKQNLIQ